jgi:hypothetical protein
LPPDLVMAETASALWKAVRFAGLELATATEAIAAAGAAFDELVSARTLADRALAIALEAILSTTASISLWPRRAAAGW